VTKKNTIIQKPSSFYEYLGYTYVAYANMCVRRLIKSDRSSISLTRLLEELIQDPKQISRTYYRTLYINVPELADGDFDRFCDKPGEPYISSTLVKKDFEVLTNNAKNLEVYADKVIAHIDKTPPQQIPTFNDLNVFIADLEVMIKKYVLMLTGVGMLSLMPVYQYDWQEIFDTQWRV